MVVKMLIRDGRQEMLHLILLLFWKFLKNPRKEPTLKFFYKRFCYGFFHCVKSVQIRSFFWSVFSRIRTEYREILRIWTLFRQCFHKIFQNMSGELSLNVWKIFRDHGYFYRIETKFSRLKFSETSLDGSLLYLF